MDTKLILISTTVLVIAASSAPAAAQRHMGRDAAITRCIAQAQREYPGDFGDVMRNRTYSYKACMFRLGFRP